MRVRILITAFLFAVVFAVSALGHHSINAEFDRNKTVTLAGTIINVDWMNPHTYVFVDVKDPEVHKTRTWACELASPAELARQGFTRESLKVGMSVRVAGSRAKDGSFKIHIERLAAENGVSLTN